MIRTFTTIALLSLPLFAQESGDTPKPLKVGNAPAAVEVDNILYRAFWLERSQARRTTEALALYKEFLEKAPKHKDAGQAATYALSILTRMGKTAEADEFKAKHADILKNAEPKAPDAPDAVPAEGRRAGGGGNRPNLETLKADLEKAKAAGDEAKAKELADQIKRAEERAAGRGQGGPGGAGRPGRGGQAFNKPIGEMNDEELGQLKTGLDTMSERMIGRMRDQGQGEQADKLEASVKQIKEALAAGKKDEAEKARLELVKLMSARRGGGGR